MKSSRMLAPIAMVVVMIFCGCARESGLPEAQEWTFDIEKVWEIQQVGEDELLRPAEPRVADDGTLFFHDFERHLSYIVDSDGNLVGTFAPQGSDEGEVQFYINCFPAGDHVVICAPDKLHFFDKQGKFIKAVQNNLFVRFPLAFKNENEFWVAPGALGDSPGGLAKVIHVNLTSGEESVVHEFTLSDAEKRPSGGGVVVGLTPQAKMGYDRRSNRVYFGKNSDTLIYWLAGDADAVESFSFKGDLRPVSKADKRAHFAQFDIPEEHVTTMIEALPDQMTFYNRIQVVDGLVYLLSAESFGNPLKGQAVDVFSPDGRHLYYGRIMVEEGWHIFGNPENLQLAQGHIYAVLENDSGNKKIVKYTISLPRS